MDDDRVNSTHEGNGNGSDNNENGSSGSTASSSSSGTSSSDSGSRSSSPARASSSSGSSEDESDHRTVENEPPSEEVKIDYSDEEEKEMIAERSGRNESEDVNVLVDDDEVKITDSDDEQEVKITDSDNGEEDVNAESKSGKNESIDDEKGEEIKIVEEEVNAETERGKNESIVDEEGEKIQIVDSDDDRDVNIDDMDVDHESNALGDHIEVEVKDEDPMKMAYDEREKEEQPRTDPIDEKNDETIYPGYYNRRLMLTQHAAEVVNPRAKRPREEVEEKREHVKRKKKDETLSMEIPTKAAEALSERILLNPVPRQPRLSVKTENKKEPKKINKGLVETLLMEMPPKAAEGLPELIAVSPVRSQQGPSMKPEMKKESKNPSKESPVEALSKESLTKDGIFANTATSEQEPYVKSEKKKEPRKPSREPLRTLSNETPITHDAEELSRRIVENTIRKKRGFSLKDEKEQPKKPSNAAVEISKHKTLNALAEQKAKDTRIDEGKYVHEDVRKKSEKDSKKPIEGAAGIPKKEIPRVSKADEKPKEKKADEPRGRKKSEQEHRKLLEKENKPKHKDDSSQGSAAKSLTPNEARPSRKPETKKEPKKSQSIPKKTSHMDGSDISQPKVENPSQVIEIDEKLLNKVLNPPKIVTEGGEIRIPMDVDEPDKEVESPHEVHEARKREKKSSGARQETSGVSGEPLLEQAEITKSDERGEEAGSGEKPRTDKRGVHREEAGSGEKPKTDNIGKRNRIPSSDCGDDCYKQYQKDVPDRWEPVSNYKTFSEYIQAFEKRYPCYCLIRGQLLETIKIFEERRLLVEGAKSKDNQLLLNLLKEEAMHKYQEESTRYFEKKKAYTVLHKELDVI